MKDPDQSVAAHNHHKNRVLAFAIPDLIGPVEHREDGFIWYNTAKGERFVSVEDFVPLIDKTKKRLEHEDLVEDGTRKVATNIALDTIRAATMGSDTEKPKGFI